MTSARKYEEHRVRLHGKVVRENSVSHTLASIGSINDYISQRLELSESYNSQGLQKPHKNGSQNKEQNADGRLYRTHAELNSLYQSRRRLLRSLPGKGLPKNHWTECQGTFVHLSSVEHDGLAEYALIALPKRSSRYLIDGEPPEVSRRRAQYAAHLHKAALQAYTILGTFLMVGLLAKPLSGFPILMLLAVLAAVTTAALLSGGRTYILKHCGTNPPENPFDHVLPELTRKYRTSTSPQYGPTTPADNPAQVNEAQASESAAFRIFDGPLPLAPGPAKADKLTLGEPRFLQQSLDLFGSLDPTAVNDLSKNQREKP